jgi:hypothetical protein
VAPKKPTIVPAGTPNDGFSEGWSPVEEPPVFANAPPAAGAPGVGPQAPAPFFAASIPAGMQLQTDIVKTEYPGSVGGLRIMPPGPSGVAGVNAAAVSVVTPVANNLQEQITALQQAPAPTSVTDGLTHGTDPWESDPGYIVLRDDFHAGLNSNNLTGTQPTTGIGQLGWALIGSVGSQGGVAGGQPPNLGIFGWSNSGTSGAAGWLTLAGSGGFSSSNYSQLGWALADNPGWIMSFVFKVDTGNPLSSSPKFSMAQTSIYVGLTGQIIAPLAAGLISRPDIFIGVRYDTSTTSPSIGDSFFTLEVVANPQVQPYARNNTQGTTLVTTVAPVQGAWHRLDIICDSAGSVTLTLDDTFTLTAAIPTYSITASIGTLQANGQGRFAWTVTGSVPASAWNIGSIVTASGFTSTLAALNGPHTLNASVDSEVGFLYSGSAGGSQTATLTGFPSLIPIFMAGQDDSASPDFNDWTFWADYYVYIWNPNLGPNAPGTPNATKSRYF